MLFLSLLILIIVSTILYRLNRVGYKIDLLWLDKSDTNQRILNDLNKKK